MTTLHDAGYRMVQSSYQNLWKSCAATGVAWLSRDLITRLDLNAACTTTFTAAASVIYYTMRPFFEISESNAGIQGTLQASLNRCITLVILTKAFADWQKLGISFLVPYAKTAAVAFAIIFAIESAGKALLPRLNKMMNFQSITPINSARSTEWGGENPSRRYGAGGW